MPFKIFNLDNKAFTIKSQLSSCDFVLAKKATQTIKQ